jgi:hypothetical protein
VKHTREILAAAGLLIVTGTMSTAQADNDTNRITLYTSAIHTGVIACNAINVSKKTLNITISIFDGTMPTGNETSPILLEGPTLIKTPPGMEATFDHGSPTDSNEGYCVFQVSGTGIGMTCGRFRMPSSPERAPWRWTALRPPSRSLYTGCSRPISRACLVHRQATPAFGGHPR